MSRGDQGTSSPPKEVSHEQVKERYRLVKQHDRVGRTDTQEFTNFEFPLDRISPELLARAQGGGPSALTIGRQAGDKTPHTERKMIPLNLYLDRADEQQTRLALEEATGNAIRQRAAANIFLAILSKRFGVTRHGRVVSPRLRRFALRRSNFRQIRHRATLRDREAEPWYSVAPERHLPEGVRHLPAAKAPGAGD